MSGTTGAVLDPIFALRTAVKVPAGRSVSVAFTTLVAGTRERAFELADRYRNAHAAQRALDLAWTSTQIELNELGISPNDAADFQELAGHMFFAADRLGPASRIARAESASQGTLWSLGIRAIAYPAGHFRFRERPADAFASCSQRIVTGGSRVAGRPRVINAQEHVISKS